MANNVTQIPAYINGVQYAWSNISLSMLQGKVVNVTSIEYSDNTEMEMIFASGNQPVGRGYGNYTTTVKLTILMEDVLALQSIVSSGRIQDIAPFTINVSYMLDNPAKAVTDKLYNCQFMTNGRTVAQNDKSIEVSLDISCTHIEFGTLPV